MNLFYQPDISKGILNLDPDESRHAIKVLRMKSGDVIDITDGAGNFYRASITDDDQKKCLFSIIEKNEVAARNFNITIAIAPTKNIDRTEWFIEKAVEVGVDRIQLMWCKNSERKNVNHERLIKIAVSAMKQSGQARLPLLSTPVTFKEAILIPSDQKFICYVDKSNPDHLISLAHQKKNYLVLIGPEGDFNREELQLAIEHDFKKVSLGQNRLRTETAALTACLMLNFINL